MKGQGVSEAFYLASQVLFEQAHAEGYDNFGEYPGFVETMVGSCRIRLHTQEEPSDGLTPFRVYVDYNGRQAGILDVGGGVTAAGKAANENSLCQALQEVLKDAQDS